MSKIALLIVVALFGMMLSGCTTTNMQTIEAINNRLTSIEKAISGDQTRERVAENPNPYLKSVPMSFARSETTRSNANLTLAQKEFIVMIMEYLERTNK